ncbi:putative uncharacterized protein [Parachlamydia acanthamoebae UV-7]|jgi:hypothetical protein|uniref:Nucleotide-diphospho-sugar transferase domain-containing protein n=2 Tax=Parachlamydia acanthamoebae TaxID=83552 RepID=F8KWV3_PARAV|nr:DUF6492 family protein [Parachlamydia acanthamoebae]EFB40771.1 hypothetical protein pah_c188o016 [Parachlamydia acanthamoebae str. Hall's coccus]CCB86519.1 putative uncharacterized protein [Parachlamydia acanthamoebae UV-7]
MQRFIHVFIFIFFHLIQGSLPAQQYSFTDEAIDVVIPCTAKDLEILNFCIAGLKANCAQIRRIIVVSSHPLTDQAEWFDEANFPFNKAEIAFHLLKGDTNASQYYLQDPARLGWYYQQMLKYYAAFVIPDISSNILILDSDTIFLNPVEFLSADFGGLYNPGTEYHKTYFEHADRFLPGLRRLYPEHSGISHHMLFQAPVLQELFTAVENYHKMPLWQAFCRCVSADYTLASGASEFEIYFNFVFSRTNQVKLRHLKWKNVSNLKHLSQYKAQGYHYVSCHAWSRI